MLYNVEDKRQQQVDNCWWGTCRREGRQKMVYVILSGRYFSFSSAVRRSMKSAMRSCSSLWQEHDSIICTLLASDARHTLMHVTCN